MSTTSPNNLNHHQLLQFIKLTIGNSYLQDVDQQINSLLQQDSAVNVLENKNYDSVSLDSFCEILQSIKLILELAEWNLQTQKDIQCDSGIENVLQCVRDIIDERPHQTVLLAAFDLLYPLSRLCLIRDIELLTKFYGYQIHLAQHSSNEETIVPRLKAINVILETVVKSTEADIQRFRNSYEIVNCSVDEEKLFLKLLLQYPDAVSALTLLTVLPHYVKIFNKLSTLFILWCETLDSTFKTNGNDTLRQFTVLCFIFDLFAEDNTEESSSNMEMLLQDEKYWRVVQGGLQKSCHVLRKQALYLLKRSIHEIDVRNLSLKCMSEVSGSYFKEKLDDGAVKLINGMKNVTIRNSKIFLVNQQNDWVMWWEPELKKELLLLFDDLFLVFETAEEKQAHIVKPVCTTMTRLASAAVNPFQNGKCLHISWILVLIQRLLDHDNVAVIRWGFRQLLLIEKSFLKNENAIKQIIHLIVKSVADPNIFVNNVESIRTELKMYFEEVAISSSAVVFFRLLIEEMSVRSWSPEPLFILLDSLKDIKVLSWESKELTLVKGLVSTSIATHYKFLRSAIQCHFLTLIVNLTNVPVVSLDALADVFRSFRRQESLHRGSQAWQTVVNWLEFCFSKRNAEEYILSNVPYSSEQSANPSKVARMTCLLYDAHLFGIMKCCGEAPSTNVITIFKTVLLSLKEADKRLYASQDELTHHLSMIQHILEENVMAKNAERSHLVEIMLPYFGGILTYVLSKSRTMNNSSDYETCQNLISVVEYVLNAQKMYNINSEPYVNTMFEHCLKTLGVVDPLESSALEKYTAMNFLRIILEYVYQEKTVPRLKLLKAFVKKSVNVSLSKPQTNLSSDSKSLWGKINSGYLEAQWWVIGRLKAENLLTVLPKVTVEQFLGSEELAVLCNEALELCGGAVLLPVMTVAEDLLPDLKEHVLERLVRACWDGVVETRRNEAFTPAANRFIPMLFQPELIKRQSSQSLLLEFSSVLLSESVNGLGNSFMSHVQKLHVKYESSPLWAQVLAEAVVFGPVSRREDRLTVQVCALVEGISCSANELVLNEWNTSREIRARALTILLTLSPEQHSSFADSIAAALLHKEKTATGGKSRHFAGSLLHLVRTRILQALLILEPLLSMETRSSLYDWLCASLLKESQQPSVRYLTEWLIVRILWRSPQLQDSLWLHFTEALEQRVGSLCSFITVVYHTLGVLSDAVLELWIDRANTQFLPYCLAQHFSLRLYAQVALEKIWALAEQRGLSGVILKYAVVRDCIARGVGNGNALRNADKLRTDFYWTVFHPLHHFSLLTIYRDLPRLAHVPSDEWITPEILKAAGVPMKLQHIPWSSGDLLWDHPVASWTVRPTEETLEVPSEIYQKKMIPVKALVPDYSESLGSTLTTNSRKKQIQSDGLIVVASLVDRSANLGGLSRTCEAFGVSELVIDSLKILEDKQFLSLSVTSEKWVPITEVKSHLISDYILRLKKDGYVVVGAEQTSRSKALHEVTFPSRSVLLLGNEKEGLPPQLLPLLDICVEVPQLGVIRSLNVHVTGALFIWEYAKQHLITSKKRGEV